MTSKELYEIQMALKAGDNLSDAHFVKVAELRHKDNEPKRFAQIGKFALRQGEELWDFIGALAGAVSQDRVILADGSLDAWLQGIYEDHVIVQDGNTGRLFRANFTRNDKGEFSFDHPVEVMSIFVPVDPAAGDDMQKSIAKRAPEVSQIVDIAKSDAGKWSFLPRSLRSVGR